MNKEKPKNKEKEKNKNLSEDLLNSYRAALYKVRDFFDSIDNYNMGEDMSETMKVIKSILEAGSQLGKNIETLSILEKKVASDEGMKTKARGGADISLFEDK